MLYIQKQFKFKSQSKCYVILYIDIDAKIKKYKDK